MNRNKHVFPAGSRALDRRLLVLLTLSRRSGFMPENNQDVLLAAASMACGGLSHTLEVATVALV